ncbi:MULTISPECIES: phosphate acyltransferase PlsX [Acidocella]|uniref:phosphate acyltransferase PlsX n=1 Tax=Acidocella TaxID=50709 RepID=UPI00047D561B|nr:MULTISPECIES: phosphate acyltransferase PlsX [Acidocella]WBO60173.1 phosphate acyltransferase PlsX [Acidocella sp. MX-AZ03]
MSQSSKLAVDAMGGDHAPDAIIAGLDIAAERHPQAQFLIFGDEVRLRPVLAKCKRLAGRYELRHAAEVITGDMKPTVALRLRDSSLRRAIDAVLAGEAEGVISAGNTGALLALSKIVLKTLKGIDRPAMAAIAPSAKGDVVMLDLGLNVVYDARNLVEFALMGTVFARIVLGLPTPTFGLLNIGSEEGKGDETLRAASNTLRESPIAGQFYGFVEGHDIAAGTVDVVVTDGFTGNVALKTGEGALKLVGDLLRQVFSAGPFAKMGYLFARGALKRLKETLDPRRYNGAVLLGLNGVVVKSHGGTDALGFAHAVDVALDMIANDFNSRIADALTAMDHAILSEAPVPNQNG